MNSLDKRIKVKLFKKVFRFGGLSVCLDSLWSLGNDIKNADVIHFHSFTSFINIPVLWKAYKYQIPIVIDVHGNLPGTDEKFRKKIFHYLVGKKMFLKAELFVAETMKGKEEYMALGADQNKLVVQHPGFDVDEMRSFPERGTFRKEYGISDAEKVVLFLGRIHEIKGIDFLLDGYNELVKTKNDVTLVIAGPDDGHLSVLKAKIEKYGIGDKIKFPGFMNLEQKKAVLSDADLFVQPSRYEQGIAHTTIEALLAGLPVIATTNNGAAEDIERMDCGILVDYGDNELLSAEMEKALYSKSRIHEKVVNGVNYINENLAITKTSDLFLDFFSKLKGTR